MRDISEYKLLGYYLLKMYEKTGVDSLKYEQAKAITDGVFKKINNSQYNLLPLDNKMNLVKSMINKGVFKTTVVNGNHTFTQVYNFEISKHIFASYNNCGSLLFKLPKEIKLDNETVLQSIKKIYESNLGLDLQQAINSEIDKIKSQQTKNRSFA